MERMLKCCGQAREAIGQSRPEWQEYLKMRG